MPNRSVWPRLRGPATVSLLIALPLLAVLATAAVVTHLSPGNAAPGPPTHTVRYEATGVPGDRFSISYVGDGSGTMITSADTPVPWHADTTLHRMAAPFVELRMTVVRGAAPRPPVAATTDCRIIADGRVVAENHTSARSAFVDCNAIVP
jgi:hypothetical protein